MGLLKHDSFICLDLETTGLNPETDEIIEVAAVIFNFSEHLDTFETLIDPGKEISKESIEIHHITDDMVKGKPKIQEILPQLVKMIGSHIIVGHGINTDLAFLNTALKKYCIPHNMHNNPIIDTLRLARLYGECSVNSLEMLRTHFNIANEGAHRAMSDVVVNIEVFKYLCQQFKKTEQVLDRLRSPILLKTMPLGKHKGRLFSQIPVEYLRWALHKDFDQDLLYSIRNELKKRKQGGLFQQAANPFSNFEW